MLAGPSLTSHTQRQTFRAGVDLVQVDAVVTDAHDRPVSDLPADAFEIREDGHPQTIATFRVVSIPPASRTVDGSAGPPRDVVSNAHPQDSRLVVVLIDDVHVSVDAEKLHQLRVLITNLLERFTAQDEIAVVFTSRSDLAVDFTRDLAHQVAALDHLREALGRTGVGSASQRFDSLTSLRTLQNVCRAMLDPDYSRRMIVYVGEQLPVVYFEPGPAHDALMDLFRLARDADIEIYPIDPRGLVPLSAASDIDAIADEHDSLHVLALNTGGRAFVERSSLPSAVREIAAENGAFYLLGYYRDPAVHDGRFHRIDVRVNRPGLRVRARQGYLAPSALVSPAEPSGGQAAIEDALRRGTSQSAVPLEAFAAALAPADRGRVTTLVSVQVAYPPAAVPPAGAAAPDHVTYELLASDHDGHVKASAKGTADLRRDDALFQAVLDLPPGPTILRAAVRSPVLAATGTVHLALEVPDLAGDRLALSDLVLGREATASTAPPGLATLVPIQPMLTRAFGPGETFRVYARVYWRARDAAAVTVTSRLTQGKTVRWRTLRTLPGDTLADGRRTVAVTQQIALTSLQPGSYVLEVQAESRSGTTVRRDVPIEIR
jgi:VWFA-related protein